MHNGAYYPTNPETAFESENALKVTDINEVMQIRRGQINSETLAGKKVKVDGTIENKLHSYIPTAATSCFVVNLRRSHNA